MGSERVPLGKLQRRAKRSLVGRRWGCPPSREYSFGGEPLVLPMKLERFTLRFGRRVRPQGHAPAEKREERDD